MEPSTASLDIYETADPVCIGSGSFATIYVTKGNPIAFKVVHYESDSEALLEEFGALRELYQKCASSPGFLVPGPKGFYDPAKMMVVFHSGQSVPLMTASPEAIAARPIPTLFDDVYSKHGRAMYAMTRVHRFPVDMAHILSEKYIPSSFSVKDPPFLLRLYFGKQLKITRFTNTRNFPVDIERYEYLRDTAQATLPGSPPLPPVLELVGYMGQTLGKIHFYAGYDARDVEFICGGDGWSEACFYVIDFNQMRRWSMTNELEGIEMLVDSFFQNDPYYPRPVVGDIYYGAFKDGYIDQLNTPEQKSVAGAFFQALEAHHIKKVQHQEAMAQKE